MNICYIIGAGECAPMDFDPGETDLLIAADGGYRAVCDAGMRPDLIVGDFDSLGSVPTDAPVVRCPVEKDDTDTMIAIKEGLARGYQRFQIYGGLGGRLDHTIANLHALAYLADHGARGRLVGVREYVDILPAGTSTVYHEGRGVISIFAWGGNATGVTLTGLHYPLHDATLTPNFPLGVSNDFTGLPARVSVRTGKLIVIINRN